MTTAHDVAFGKRPTYWAHRGTRISTGELMSNAWRHAPTFARMWPRRGWASARVADWDENYHFSTIKSYWNSTIRGLTDEYEANRRSEKLVEHMQCFEHSILHGQSKEPDWRQHSEAAGLEELGLDADDAQLLFLCVPRHQRVLDDWSYSLMVPSDTILSVFTIVPRDVELAFA